MEMVREAGNSDAPLDHSQPLRGVVVCCTSIAVDRRTELEKKIQQLGGTHKYDLTADVTHLIVGQYDTPKYRHVAKERPDVKAMDARWIDTVTDLWMTDAHIDLPSLEKQWQLLPLETCGPESSDGDRGRLICCITGFHDPGQRQGIVDMITEHGGTYTPDLDRKLVTHLIVCQPEGKKYNAARRWGIQTVSLAWLTQTIERGLILHEQYFDPSLPEAEQGRGAWIRPEERAAALGKRSRSAAEQGQRKLRKTASMKLSSQRDTLWGDILGSHSKAAEVPDSSTPLAADDRVEVADSARDLAAHHPPPDAGIFSSCTFVMAGFERWQHDIIRSTAESMGGRTVETVEALAASTGPNSFRLFLVVPQNSQPGARPKLPLAAAQDIDIVTEFFIERCLHQKSLCEPNEHVLGRPFTRFPIEGFEGLAVCTAGFTGIDLLHVEKCVRWMGAKYATRLNESTSILVCKSLQDTRKEKLKLALDNQIPVVSTDWLWACVSAGSNVPVQRFLFAELRQDPFIAPKPKPREEKPFGLERTISEPVPAPNASSSKPRTLQRSFVDKTAFAGPPVTSVEGGEETPRKDSGSTRFETAKSHFTDTFGSGTVPAPSNEPPAQVANKASSQHNAAESAESGSTEDQPDTSEPSDDTPLQQPEPVPQQPEKESPTDAEEEAPEDQSKQRQDEQKAAERADLASKILASKLNSLKDPTRVAAEGNPRRASDTSREEEATAKPARRKKGIFGRAVSNVSAASSGSHESGNALPSGPGAPLEGTGEGLLRTRSDGALFGISAPVEDEGDSRRLPSTQIGYQDAEGAQLKAELMQRMLAGEQGGIAPPITSTNAAPSTRSKQPQRSSRRKGF